jgi:hypothetical protein
MRAVATSTSFAVKVEVEKLCLKNNGIAPEVRLRRLGEHRQSPMLSPALQPWLADPPSPPLLLEWQNEVGDMLAYVNDKLVPHGFDEIVKDEFAGLRQMLRRR